MMTNQNEMTKKVTELILSKNKLPQQEYTSLLEKQIKELPYGGADTFQSTPVLIDKNYIENSQKLSSILNTVLVHFAYNYFRDPNISMIYNLDKELQGILAMAEGVPYELGMYQTDFIYDLNGNPRICKIGCQSPINGWMFSLYMNQVTDQLAGNVDENWSAISQLNDFMDEFCNRFDSDDTLFFIHKKEEGAEIHFLKAELAKRGINMIGVQPEDVKLVDGKLKVGENDARQFYLEMNREELKLFDKEVLKAVINSGRCINDVRTLILVHDKRVLTLLSNTTIMGSYINSEDFNFLATYLIPSYNIDRPEDREFLLNSSENWILKTNIGEKEINTLVTNDTSKEVWEDTIKNKWSDYMIQPYLQQKEFELDRNGSKESIHLVGMDLCFNGKFFAPGFFKASSDNIINVHGDQTAILPCVLEKRKE